MASTNYSASGATGVIDSYIECDVGSSKITLSLLVRRKDSTASIDGTYNVSGSSSDSGTYVLSSSYTEIWSDQFDKPSGDTLSVNLSFTIKATSPSAGVKTVNATLTKVYLDDDDDDDDSGGSSGGSSSSTREYAYLWILEAPGLKFTVKRTKAYYGGNIGKLINPDATDEEEDGVVWKGFKVWKGDEFEITVEALSGYTLRMIDHGVFEFGYGVSGLNVFSDGSGDIAGWMLNNIPNDPDDDPYVFAYAVPNAYKLSVSEGSSSGLSIIRTKSNMYAEDGWWISVGNELKNGDVIYHDDQLQITCTPDTGYKLSSLIAGGASISSGDTYIVSGDTTVQSVADVISYVLTLNADTGVTITANRTSSPKKGAAKKTFTSSGKETTFNDIYYGDVLTINFESSAEYKINYQAVNGETFVSGSTLTVYSDIDAVAITELSGIVHIFNGSQFDNYIIFIFNGSTWDQYIPYVFDGTKWCICS